VDYDFNLEPSKNITRRRTTAATQQQYLVLKADDPIIRMHIHYNDSIF